MFPYFGKKQRHAKDYPAPEYSIVIEPFAGSMGYTMFHRPDKALGIDADSRVVELWHRGVDMGLSGRLPDPPVVGSRTDDLFVKLCSYSEHALTSGTMTVTTRMVRDWGTVTTRMAEAGRWSNKHVEYMHGTYSDAPDIEATWFIDPPYQKANRRGYKHRSIDFSALAEFCRSRRGQVIVCEQSGADWLPFHPLYDLGSHRGSKSTEVIWTQNPSIKRMRKGNNR